MAVLGITKNNRCRIENLLETSKFLPVGGVKMLYQEEQEGDWLFLCCVVRKSNRQQQQQQQQRSARGLMMINLSKKEVSFERKCPLFLPGKRGYVSKDL